MTEEKKHYDPIKCNGCGEAIRFVKGRNKEGQLKNIPVNIDPAFILISSGEKDEKGQYIYIYRKGYVSHFATCPKAETFRNRDKKPKDRTADEILKDIDKSEATDADKPPF